MLVPMIPERMATTSLKFSFSLIKMKANKPAKIGPVVKLMQLLIERGIYAMAAY